MPSHSFIQWLYKKKKERKNIYINKKIPDTETISPGNVTCKFYSSSLYQLGKGSGYAYMQAYFHACAFRMHTYVQALSTMSRHFGTKTKMVVLLASSNIPLSLSRTNNE